MERLQQTSDLWPTTAVDHVLNMPDVSDDQKVAMLGGNAATLLNIPL